MRIVAVLQARITSTRLPGKVLKPILSRPMLARQIERIQRSKKINAITLATSTDKSDEPLKALAKDCGVSFYAGSLNDVLDRFYNAVKGNKPDHIVRLTGDCPLLDPTVIDQLIELHVNERNDYSSNCYPPTYPDGLDTEIMTFSALERAWKEAGLPSDREHVTPYLRKASAGVKVGVLSNNENLSHHRWTVDEPEDFEKVAWIYQALYPVNSNFMTDDILRFLKENPAVDKLNHKFARNEGYAKSLKEDELFLKGKKK